jgi:hypothetical protein
MAIGSNDAGRLPAKTQDVLLLVGRVALGAIFVKSGIQKLLALSAFAAVLSSRGVPEAWTWAVIGATVEFVGGILIITGFTTRFASHPGEPVLQEPLDRRRLRAAVRDRLGPLRARHPVAAQEKRLTRLHDGASTSALCSRAHTSEGSVVFAS